MIVRLTTVVGLLVSTVAVAGGLPLCLLISVRGISRVCRVKNRFDLIFKVRFLKPARGCQFGGSSWVETMSKAGGNQLRLRAPTETKRFTWFEQDAPRVSFARCARASYKSTCARSSLIGLASRAARYVSCRRQTSFKYYGIHSLCRSPAAKLTKLCVG